MYTTATVVDTYIAMWNEPDADERRALVSAALSADATYIDPPMSGQGTEAISAMIGAAEEVYPGHRFALVGEPDSHHDYVRFTLSLATDRRAARGHRHRLRGHRRGRPADVGGRIPRGGRVVG